MDFEWDYEWGISNDSDVDEDNDKDKVEVEVEDEDTVEARQAAARLAMLEVLRGAMELQQAPDATLRVIGTPLA